MRMTQMHDVAQKLIELIETQLFSKEFKPVEGERVIESASDAEIFASDQEVDFIKGKEFQGWTGILEEHARSGEVMDVVEASAGKMDPDELERVFRCAVSPVLRSKYDENQSSDTLYDVLCGELYNIYTGLVLFDAQSDFHQRMLDIFQRSGMPCGWRGVYPSGSMLVYPLKKS